MPNPKKRELLALRRRRSLQSQIAIAAQLGISQGHYSNIENGYADPNDELAKSLITLFDLPADYFTEVHEQ